MLDPHHTEKPSAQHKDSVVPDYHEVLFNAPIGVSLSTTGGNFIMVNAALARMFGYDSPQEMIDSVTDISGQLYADPVDRKKMQHLLEESEEILNHECRFVRKDGTLFWGSRSVQAVRNSKGDVNYYKSYVSDITDKKQAELKLEKTQKDFSTILDTVPAMIWQKDVQGNYVHANKMFCETVGLELEDLLGKNDFDVHPKRIAWKYSQDDQKVISTGKPLRNINERHRKTTGKIGWSLTEKLPYRDDQGRITGTMGFALDVTEVRQKAHELKESEERFQTLVENLPVMINAGTKEGLFTYWNKACEKTTGYSSHEIIGNPEALTLLYPEAGLSKQILSEWKKKGDLFNNHELALTSRYGSKHHILWSNLPQEISFSGNDIWAVGMDITSLKQTEDALREHETLQRLLMHMATGFINISLDEVDKTLNELLEAVGKFTRVDRAYIFRHDHVRQTTRNTHEWCAEGVSSEIDSLQEISFCLFSEILEVLQKGEPFYVHDLNEISVDVDLRNHLQDQGIKSLINIPLMHDGINTGFVGFDIIRETRFFTESKIGLLKVMAEIVSNVMARQTAEEKLKNSEKFLRDVTEGIPGAVYQFQMNDSGKLTLEYISPGVEEVYGKPIQNIELPYTLERLLSKVHPKDRDKFMTSIHESVRALQPWQQEIRIINAEGDTKWVHAHSCPNMSEQGIVWNGVMMDITERKQAESRIMEAHQTLLTILDNSKSFIYVADMDSHEILFINEAVRNLFGNVVGQKCWEVIQGIDNGPCDFCTNSKLLDEHGEPTGIYRWELHNKKTKTWLECQDIAIRWTDGRMVRLEAAIDITERKQAEEDLKESRQRFEYLLQSTARNKSFHNIIGRSKQIQKVYTTIQQVAGVDTTILITGETGTGKELVADALHASSPRSKGPLIKVNCLTLSDELLDSELFGHVKGAFTGAYANKIGRVEAAEGGTLFLDEIGDLTPRIQLKLLRFLQQKEYERVGESITHKADVRIVAATNADLAQKVEEGSFRKDLYFRIKVLNIHVPPLRERTEDIPLLMDHFRRFFSEKFGKNIKGFSAAAVRALVNYSWPGNVRELEHLIERASLVSPNKIIEPEHFCMEETAEEQQSSLANKSPIVDREDLVRALEAAGGKKTDAARMLGISRRTLYRKLHEHGLIK